jgi:hypothetical protein
LINPGFQLKYTAWLVAAVASVLLVLGFLVEQTAVDAVSGASAATSQAARALEESRANSALTRQNVALTAQDNPDLASLLQSSLDEGDRKAKAELDTLRARESALTARLTRLKFTIVGAGLALLLVLIGVGITITQRIVGPVHKMKRLLWRVSTGRLVVSEKLRKGDELGDLFDTFVQMTYSLRALERARLATLMSTLEDAEKSSAAPEVIEGLRALRVELEPGLGLERMMRRSHADIEHDESE